MLFSATTIILLAAGSAKHVNAHVAFTNFFVDGVNQGDGTAVRMSNSIPHATFPLPDITAPDMACGAHGEVGVSRIAAAKAGSNLVFEFRSWPDGSKSGTIDISHKGPCAVYMKKVDDASASDNAVGGGWFKVMEDDYDSTTAKWCTEKLIPNNGHLAATIPKDLAAGYYLVRPELLALHNADKIPADPQFYVGCAQIYLTGSGTVKPSDTVAIPGYVNLSTPAMTYNIWQKPLKLPFPSFGPPVYHPGATKRGIQTRATAQTVGLKPQGCMITNANWCSFMPPKYTDQDSCWASSKNCSAQTTSCYDSAGPTGSKNCHSWENYCTKLRDECASGSYNGPPACSSFMPAPLEKLDMSKAVTGTELKKQDADPASQSSTNPTVPSSESTASASIYTAPSTSPSSVDNSMANGSIDTCGNNGGQKCKTGMCCSSHGYCGTSDDYCGAGCQISFGKCSGQHKHKRAHMRHSHIFRRGGLGLKN